MGHIIFFIIKPLYSIVFHAYLYFQVYIFINLIIDKLKFF